MGIDEFSGAFSTAYDPLGSGRASRVCISVDWACFGTSDEINAIDLDAKARAESFSQMAIQVLTGFQVGRCPVTVRPCVAKCAESSSGFSAGPWMTPYVHEGKWYNSCGCKRNDCSCAELTVVRLAAKVGEVTDVRVGGVVLSPSVDYRVDNSNELVRIGGPEWPSCQDMAAGPNDPGTMFVSYVPGAMLDSMGQYVAGLLAKEYLNACADEECHLPSSIISLARQGVTMEFGKDVFPNGLTGIDSVDLWVRSWNPYSVKSPSTIFSPDRHGHRSTTWSA